MMSRALTVDALWAGHYGGKVQPTVTLAIPAYATLEQAGANYWELSSQPSEKARTSKGT